MSTIDTHNHTAGGTESKPLWARYVHGHHWRNQAEEFDGLKLGFWLFLTTEVLLFAGIFCAYSLFRSMYPAAWAEGSQSLDWRWGGLNTIVLLISSYTIAASIYCFQTNQQARARVNLLITFLSGAAVIAIDASKTAFQHLFLSWMTFIGAFSASTAARSSATRVGQAIARTATATAVRRELRIRCGPPSGAGRVAEGR